MLAKTSLINSQITFCETTKYFARLRTVKSDGRPLLLHINMDGGHSGAFGRYD